MSGEIRSPAVLTDAERRALAVTAEVTNLMNEVIGDGPARDADLAEVVIHVHGIQHMIMAQAAARAYPEDYRLLGGA